ncbi:UNVERIFIED_CONTAM: hypothetical protein GTU68_045403, partial [Idotea baltica]|nr:hypothetical protein [Idotea baltica]
MEMANLQAQQTFKYFWREVYWEYRRIVPSHDLAIVKVPFEQQFQNVNGPTVEHMWINQINFDGEKINGVLMNSPNQLTNIAEGDEVSVSIKGISDWMMATNGKTYGGFTIHVLRSDMSVNDRQQHDSAWGLDFGDYDDILIAYEQKEHPENLIEHPMSINMEEKAREFFKDNPDSIHVKDENGLTMLHREAIAGNKTTVTLLLALGADKNAKTNNGKTALDYVNTLNW